MESRRIFYDGNMLYGDSVFKGSRTMMNTEETSKRILCFSTAEELMFGEEYYEEPLQEKKRRLTADQVQLLEKRFEQENRLEPERKIEVAKEVGLPPRQVAVWFQNRRARLKTKQLEMGYDKLKSSYESLASKYETVLKENEMLKAEILSLTEKYKFGSNELGGEPREVHRANLIPVDAPPCIPIEAVEDRLSSEGSAILEEGECPHQVLDSGNEYDDCTVVVEDGSSSYFANVFTAMEAPEPDGWFLWT